MADPGAEFLGYVLASVASAVILLAFAFLLIDLMSV